jgi:hypothetical protein
LAAVLPSSVVVEDEASTTRKGIEHEDEEEEEEGEDGHDNDSCSLV